MVISVTSTNISESSINDFFHNTEIAVLELCNQAELDAVRSSFLNEADEGGEDKEKDSKFAKFIATIKLKIEELARKVTDTVRKIILGASTVKYTKAMAKFVKKNNMAALGLEKYVENKSDFKFYNILKLESSEVSDCETVEDFMKAFENYRTETEAGRISKYADIMLAGPNPNVFKYIGDKKKEVLKQINDDAKNKSISKEESIKKIKITMNWYTASLKSMIFNVKTLIKVTKEYIAYLKKNPDETKKFGVEDSFDDFIDDEE